MMRTAAAGIFLALAALTPAQQAAAQDPVGGAIVGGTLGAIIGGAIGHGAGGAIAGAAIGATTGAVIAAEAQRRSGGYTGGTAAATTATRTAPGCRSSPVIATTEQRPDTHRPAPR
jgi:uncharacterized protein YcfJ